MNSEPATRPSGLRVLVVDDSPIMRKVVMKSLKLTGLELSELLEAGDGGQALARLAVERVDLVLSDVHMPTMGGIELVERMKESADSARIPIVMVSSQRNDAEEARLLSLGVFAYLHKPFYPEALGAVVRAALGEARS